MSHEHRFFMAQVKNSFEPIASSFGDGNGNALYEMIEYAYLVCNCGIAKKVKVQQETDHDQII